MGRKKPLTEDDLNKLLESRATEGTFAVCEFRAFGRERQSGMGVYTCVSAWNLQAREFL